MVNYTDLLTITMPVYERKDFFEEALDSALNQTVKCRIIVVDNGSSHDDFLRIVQKKNNDRVTYYKNELNIGMFGNWNKCVEYTDTEFVMILGDDDLLDKDYVESFISTYNENSSISLYYTNLCLLYGNEKREHFFNIVNYGWKKGQDIIEEGAKYSLSFPLISSCIRTSLFKLNKFIENPHMSADWAWIYLTLPKDIVVYGNSEIKFNYRKHKDSDTAKFSYCLMSLSHIYIYQKLALRLERDDARMAQLKAKYLMSSNICFFSNELEKVFIRKELYNNFVSNYILKELPDTTYLFKLFLECNFLRTLCKIGVLKIILKFKRKIFI